MNVNVSTAEKEMSEKSRTIKGNRKSYDGCADDGGGVQVTISIHIEASGRRGDGGENFQGKLVQ